MNGDDEEDGEDALEELLSYFEGRKRETCKHEFKLYIGFRERYNYCIKCDLKDFDYEKKPSSKRIRFFP